MPRKSSRLGGELASAFLGPQSDKQRVGMVMDHSSTPSASSSLHVCAKSHPAMGRGANGTKGNRALQGPRLSGKTVHGAEERLGLRPNSHGSERSQSVHQESKIQACHPKTGQTSFASEHLADSHRPQRRLLACANSPAISKVSRLPNRVFNLPMVRTSFRPEYCAKSVHQADESCGEQVCRNGNRFPVLSGRLADLSRFRGTCASISEKGTKLQHLYGVRHQLGEVLSHPITAEDLARHDLGHQKHDTSTFSRKCSENQTETITCSCGKDNVQAPMAKAHGHTELCGGGGPTRTPAPQATLPSGQQDIQRSSKTQTDTGSQNSIGSPWTVVSKRIPGACMPMATITSLPVHTLGCSGLWMGISVVRGSPGVGVLVTEEQATSHKRKGTEGSFAVSPSLSPHQGQSDMLLPRQPSGGTLHQSSRLVEVTTVTENSRENFPHYRRQEHSGVSLICAGTSQHMGRRSFSPVGFGDRVGTPNRSLSVTHKQMGNAANRPFRLPIEPPPASVHDQEQGHGRGGSGCTSGAVGQLALHIPVSSSDDDHPASNDRPTASVQRPDSSHCAPMESSSVVHDSSPCLSQSSLPRHKLHQQSRTLGVREILKFTRMEFLRTSLRNRFSETPADDMLAALSPASTRQYESCWKSFQRFLKENKIKTVSESTFFEYLSHLFHVRRRTLPTVATHSAALIDPLSYGCSVEISRRARELIRKGFFHQRPTPRPTFPKWSLHRVLITLTDEFPLAPSPELLMQKACFLLALASGLRVSQIRALTRFPNWTTFGPDDTSVTLAPSPTFLAKNEREDHRLQPILVPALPDQSQVKGLCPVYALRAYLNATSEASKEALFVRPKTLKPMSAAAIAAEIRKVICRGDPTVKPKAHDVRKVAATLAFLRTHSLERVQELGQWASCLSFIRRYLAHEIRDDDSVAMGVLPL